MRVYAIGDVHGCADRLRLLHRLIAEDAADAPAGRLAVVHLGDYVDRGPDSAAVIARLLGPPPVAGAEAVALMGNHEAMMRDALAPGASPLAIRGWLANGGTATLRSYGADPQDRGSWDRVPAPHRAFLAGLPLYWQAGDYVFVHAGLRPGLALAAQLAEDMLWIREPFLTGPGLPGPGLPGLVAVHGHTPASAPELHPHRINLDTGAVFGGPLSCAVLQESGIRFLAVPAP
jgi:serine/threonine protein phosphatase 1